jgi:hypothetical protein
MEATILKEKEIQIAGVRFRHDSNQVRFESYPKRLIYKGHEYTLVET